MFINDKLIYLQLQKTACTHIALLLNSHLPGKQVGKHGPLTRDPGDRLVVGSVRNPWSWYVSLWAFGCQQQGAIRNRLVAPFSSSFAHIVRRNWIHPTRWVQSARELRLHADKDAAHWQSLYASSEDPGLFRAWLRNMFTGQGKRLQPGQYPFLPMNQVAGLMTFRFLRLFVDDEVWQKEAADISTLPGLESLFEKHGIVDEFIRTESLERDVARLLTRLGVSVDETDLKVAKTNTSKRRNIAYYYDSESIELVRSQEQLIIEHFGYEPPEVSGNNQ